MKDPNQIRVDPEAVESTGPTRRRLSEKDRRPRFTAEDVEHFADLIRDDREGSGVVSRPGVEHVYAKVYRAVYDKLPPTLEEE